MATATDDVSPREIARRAAEIRNHWSEDQRRRRAGFVRRHWSVPTIQILDLVHAAEDLRADEVEQF